MDKLTHELLENIATARRYIRADITLLEDALKANAKKKDYVVEDHIDRVLGHLNHVSYKVLGSAHNGK